MGCTISGCRAGPGTQREVCRVNIRRRKAARKAELFREKMVRRVGGVRGGSTGQQTSVPGNRDMGRVEGRDDVCPGVWV